MMHQGIGFDKFENVLHSLSWAQNEGKDWEQYLDELVE